MPEAIISIRPHFVGSILSGKKTVELRRRIPKVEVGTRLWIYATKPIGAVVASSIVQRVIAGSPADIWEKVHDLAGLDREAFDGYFAGSARAVALFLTGTREGIPLYLEDLRNIRLRFQPPQVISKIASHEAEAIAGALYGHSVNQHCSSTRQVSRA